MEELPMVDRNRPGVFKHIEIEINTACDLDCFGCDRFSDVTTAPNMTYEQVALFVKESIDLNWEWERIRFLGGEPTIHPRFEGLIGLLLEYRKKFPKVFLQVLTNGLGKAKQYRSWLENLNISLHAEAKTKGETPVWFNNTRLCQADDEKAGPVPPCGIAGIRGCGVALTRHGFFIDGAGASAARVAGHDIGVQHLKDVTWDRLMIDHSKILCRICGHWNPAEGPKVTKLVTETGEITGPYWTEKLAAFKKQRPKLKVYGEA